MRDPLCASGQCLIFVEDRTEGCCGEYDSGDADAGPACEPPADAREQGREAAAEEEGGHEDGVGPVRGIGDGLQTAALVAQLHELGSELEEDDGGDDAGVGVAEGGSGGPGCELEDGSDGGHPSDTETRDVTAYAASRYGADHSAESEQTDGAAAGVEWLSGQVKGHAGPDAHHAAEGAGAAEGVQAHAGMGREYFPDTFDQAPVCAAESTRHLGQHPQGEDQAEQHQDGCRQEHRAPSGPLAYIAADDPGAEDAGEQAREDVAHVTGLVLRFRELAGYRDEYLGDDRAYSETERGSQYSPDAVRDGYGCRHEGCYAHDGQHYPASGPHIGHRDDEQEPEGIAGLGDHCDEVGEGAAAGQVGADVLEQRLVVVEVGHGQARHCRHHQQGGGRYASVRSKCGYPDHLFLSCIVFQNYKK